MAVEVPACHQRRPTQVHPRARPQKPIMAAMQATAVPLYWLLRVAAIPRQAVAILVIKQVTRQQPFVRKFSMDPIARWQRCPISCASKFRRHQMMIWLRILTLPLHAHSNHPRPSPAYHNHRPPEHFAPFSVVIILPLRRAVQLPPQITPPMASVCSKRQPPRNYQSLADNGIQSHNVMCEVTTIK